MKRETATESASGRHAIAPGRTFPTRSFLLSLLCWGGTFAILDSWFDCTTALGLNAPMMASLGSALAAGGAIAIVLVFASGNNAATNVREGSTLVVRRLSLFGLLMILVSCTWYNTVRTYDRTVQSIELGECTARE